MGLKSSLPAVERAARDVEGVGGAFRGELLSEFFADELKKRLPGVRIIAPRFDPAIGALLLAYRAAGREVTERLLLNLEKEK
jgi:hypothetical protein